MEESEIIKQPVRFSNHKKHYLLDILGFLLALTVALPAYINSTFLTGFVGEKYVSLVYSAGAMVAIFVFIFSSKLLNRIGNYYSSVIFIVGELTVLMILAFATSGYAIIPAFIAHIVFVTALYLNLDIFVEDISDDKDTGSIRGYLLVSIALAWVIAPSLAGIILSNSDYWRVYLSASIFFIPYLFILFLSFRNFKDPIYKEIPFWNTILSVWNNKDILNISLTNFILRFFYSWMVIYTPIYLYKHIGFSWLEIGPMFTIMLLPFIILEIPVGLLADKKFGEKEIMIIGFIITSIATASLFFITGQNFWLWAMILFLTRVGASMIEITTESYFFKHIKSNDSNTLSVFRMTKLLAILVAPLLATLVLFVFDFQYLFLVLAFIVLIGIYFPLRLKDTR